MSRLCAGMPRLTAAPPTKGGAKGPLSTCARATGSAARAAIWSKDSVVKGDRARPRLARLSVPWRALVVERGLEEAVAETRVDVELVLDAGRGELSVELLHVLHPHSRVLITPETEDRTFHLRREVDRSRRRAHVVREPVVADGGRDIASPSRQEQHDRPAHAEADRADGAVRLGSRPEPVYGRGHVVDQPGEVEALRTRHRRVARRLREWTLAEEELRRRRDESRLRETPRGVLVERTAPEDVVDHEHRRRSRTLGERDERRHRAAADRDRQLLGAHIRRRRTFGDLGVAHIARTLR